MGSVQTVLAKRVLVCLRTFVRACSPDNQRRDKVQVEKTGNLVLTVEKQMCTKCCTLPSFPSDKNQRMGRETRCPRASLCLLCLFFEESISASMLVCKACSKDRKKSRNRQCNLAVSAFGTREYGNLNRSPSFPKFVSWPRVQR